MDEGELSTARLCPQGRQTITTAGVLQGSLERSLYPGLTLAGEKRKFNISLRGVFAKVLGCFLLFSLSLRLRVKKYGIGNTYYVTFVFLLSCYFFYPQRDKLYVNEGSL